MIEKKTRNREGHTEKHSMEKKKATSGRPKDWEV